MSRFPFLPDVKNRYSGRGTSGVSVSGPVASPPPHALMAPKSARDWRARAVTARTIDVVIGASTPHAGPGTHGCIEPLDRSKLHQSFRGAGWRGRRMCRHGVKVVLLLGT